MPFAQCPSKAMLESLFGMSKHEQLSSLLIFLLLRLGYMTAILSTWTVKRRCFVTLLPQVAPLRVGQTELWGTTATLEPRNFIPLITARGATWQQHEMHRTLPDGDTVYPVEHHRGCC